MPTWCDWSPAVNCSERPKGHICVPPNRGDNDAGGSGFDEDYWERLTGVLYANNISAVCKNIHGEVIPKDDHPPECPCLDCATGKLRQEGKVWQE